MKHRYDAVAAPVAARPAPACDGWHRGHAATIEGPAVRWNEVSFDATNRHGVLGRRTDGLESPAARTPS